MLVRCDRCLLPSTKPDLVFFGDTCSACVNYEQRAGVDWDYRRRTFIDIFESQEKNSAWDCVVPVSGGKDSTYQVLKLLELGLNPLAVNSRTCDLSDLGRRNLDNIRSLGVDLIEVAPNSKIRSKLNKFGLEQLGDISWPEHLGIFTIPVNVALNFGVRIIVWGENSQNEYGGPEQAAESFVLDQAWLDEFGGLLGTRLSDAQEILNIPTQDLGIYQYPDSQRLEEAGVAGLFLGHFFPWNGLSNFLIASANGFESFGKPVEGSLVEYENLDNHQTGIHDYFKYLKFGFSRTSDIASSLIRRGLISREQGMKTVLERDGAYPSTCLGKSLEEILDPLNLTIAEFDKICDGFTNFDLFATDSNGALRRRKDGSPLLKSID